MAQTVDFGGLMTEERSRLDLLDGIVRANKSKIQPIIDRVRVELTQDPARLMTWEPIRLEVFEDRLPREIQSGWVFVLRAGADTGPERHPNSHQRMMTVDGTGDMQVQAVHDESAIGPTIEATGEWQSNILRSDPNAPLEQRWISIPPNTWHRPVVGKESHWAVVSFHTVPAEELIEEKPDSGRGTTQTKYLSQS